MTPDALDPRADGRPTGATGDVQRVLDVLDDPDCRAILDATAEAALSASEVAEACDLASSTAYRKLGRLADAGLVEERTRVRRSGKHASEYVRAVDGVVVSLADGATVRLAERAPERGTPPP